MKIILKDAEHFKQLLLMNGYTQRSFGRAIDISESYAHQVASGKRNPGPEIAKKTIDLLNVNFEDIFFTNYDHKSEQNGKQAI